LIKKFHKIFCELNLQRAAEENERTAEISCDLTFPKLGFSLQVYQPFSALEKLKTT